MKTPLRRRPRRKKKKKTPRVQPISVRIQRQPRQKRVQFATNLPIYVRNFVPFPITYGPEQIHHFWRDLPAPEPKIIIKKVADSGSQTNVTFDRSGRGREIEEEEEHKSDPGPGPGLSSTAVGSSSVDLEARRRRGRRARGRRSTYRTLGARRSGRVPIRRNRRSHGPYHIPGTKRPRIQVLPLRFL